MPDGARKNGWTRVAFGDVVRLNRERSSDPERDGFERYVGLEHIDPGDLKIRRWGDVADGTTFTNVFRPGHVLFGKRRAYLRKVALAGFEGVCSGDIYVLEPRNQSLLPELLPFICQTESFFRHAIGTSDGSLSPRTNWKSLASYEFPMPPMCEQRRIADVLTTARELTERGLHLRRQLQQVRESWLEREFAVLARDWPQQIAGDLMDRITVGIVVKPASLYVSSEGGGVPALRSLNVLPHRIVTDDLVHISEVGHANHLKSSLSPGDVVVVRSGRPGDAAVVPEGFDELNCIDLIICGPSEHLEPEFFCAALNARFGRKQFAAGSAGTAQKHFNVGALKKLRVPVPPLDTQVSFVRVLQNLSNLVADTEWRISRSKELSKSLLREVFTP